MFFHKQPRVDASQGVPWSKDRRKEGSAQITTVESPARRVSMTMHIASPLGEGLLRALRDDGERVLAKAEAEARKAKVKTEAILVEARGYGVADVILRQATNARADLIVMGTHGRRGVARLVMGSDAEGVVRGTRVPVLLVRAPEGAADASSERPGNKASLPTG